MHCTASDFGSVTLVDAWHKERDFARLSPFMREGEPEHIGYHYLITNGLLGSKAPYERAEDGRIYPCRHDNEPGAHAFGLNQKSLGVCLVGSKTFTLFQLQALECLVISLATRFDIPAERVIGHRETPFELAKTTGRKTCPNIDLGILRDVVARSRL